MHCTHLGQERNVRLCPVLSSTIQFYAKTEQQIYRDEYACRHVQADQAAGAKRMAAGGETAAGGAVDFQGALKRRMIHTLLSTSCRNYTPGIAWPGGAILSLQCDINVQRSKHDDRVCIIEY